MKLSKGLITVMIIAVLTTVLMLSACTKDISKDEADMNTLRPYHLSDEEEDLVELYTPNGATKATIQFAADESYKRVIVGYDYYENGKIVKEALGETSAEFSYEDGPQASYGRICILINDDSKDVKIMTKGSKSEDTNLMGSSSPLTDDGHEFSDMSAITSSELEGDVKIEAGRKIPVWAYIGYNDDNLSVPDLNTIMADKKVFGSYDQCCVFYAKFLTNEDQDD